MTTARPTSFDRAGTATQSAPAGWSSAIGAVLMIFPWRGKFTTMQDLVTGNAEGNAVIYVNNQIGIVSNRLDMMGVNITLGSTCLAGIKIALINCFAPFRKIAFGLSALAKQRFPAFPYGRCFAGSPRQGTFIRAKMSAVICGIKCFAARSTYFIERNAAGRPAISGTITRSIGTIGFYLERGAAQFASLYNLSIFHKLNYTTQHNITPYYVAIQRWVDMTGGTPELLDLQT